ncbi:MAG TPA: glycosyltransferase 87 family protein [Gemmatimonadaceae bacterium]
MTALASSAPASADQSRLRRFEILIALLWVAAVIGATIQQGVTHQNNNFSIFRTASLHLLHGQDLYAAYPALHRDFFKYSPTFALLFLPFALLPFGPAMLLWNALNALALYAAIGMVLPRRGATVARAIVFLDMLGSLQNVQSNALVAALIIAAFAAYERRHTVLGSLAVAAGASIKIFPLAAASFAVFHPRKIRVAFALAASFALLVALPLLVTPPATLVAQYGWWRGIETHDAVARGFSVMQMLQLLFRLDLPNWPIQLAGVLLLLAPLLARRERWGEWTFRRLYLCSVLVFCIIFNHQAESPTFVIGVAGAAIWFGSLDRPSRWEWALLAFVVVGTILASSDAMPVFIQRDVFDAYRAKTIPLIVLWIELQRRLWARREELARTVRRSSPAVRLHDGAAPAPPAM